MSLIPIPATYAPIAKLKGPKLIVAFFTIYGVKETPGEKSNPVILGWAKELGLSGVYTNDGIAWCGLTIGYLCHIVGKPSPASPLWALNWLNFGMTVKKGDEKLGDILVFNRYNAAGKLIGGHVGLYIAEDTTHFHVGGGNESDMVTIVRIAKTRLAGARRPIYVNVPAEVKKVIVDATGTVSINEA